MINTYKVWRHCSVWTQKSSRHA